MQKDAEILQTLMALNELCASGFALAMHVQFQTPRMLFQSYDPEWTAIYSAQGLVLHDPVVKWGFMNDGVIRWSEVTDLDTENVLTRAADYGLKFGGNFSVTQDGSKSICGFARPDREFDDAEIEKITALMKELHSLTKGDITLSKDTVKALEGQGILIIAA